MLYFLLIKLFKLDLILDTAFKVAAPFRSVVEEAALADVFGTLEVLVEEICTFSTATSEKVRKIDGVDHFEIRVEISSASHPFWTGQQKLVDSEGRVERFRRKYGSQ